MGSQQQISLDRATVAKLKLDDGKTDQIFFDADLRGFGYRLRNDGGRLRRTWIVQYRVRTRTRRLKIGDGAKLNADQARQAATKALAAITLGRDPQAEKETERANGSRTLRAVATEFLEMKELQVQRGEYRASSYRVTKLYLTGKYFAPLHASAITDITVADVAGRLNMINRESGTVTAGRARSALSSLFAWAMRQGHMGPNPHNPVAVTENPDDGASRDLALTDIELIQVWRAAGDDAFGKIVRLLILLGARREEIGGLRHSEIDRNAGTITLPKERTKNKHEHVLPITPLAMQIIDSVPKLVERDQLFGARSTNGFNGWDAAKKALDERLAGKLKGKSAGFRLHDLRRSLASWLADHGDVEPHIIEAILNHYSGHRSGVAGVYNRAKYARQIRAALTVWDDHLRSLIEGGKRKVLAFQQPAQTA
jgi:integrase